MVTVQSPSQPRVFSDRCTSSSSLLSPQSDQPPPIAVWIFTGSIQVWPSLILDPYGKQRVVFAETISDRDRLIFFLDRLSALDPCGLGGRSSPCQQLSCGGRSAIYWTP
jgi:hypothetical protein